MSGIRSRGRRGSTVVPNWRWEDQQLDPYDLRVAGWLASHADSYLAEHVTRNEIVRVLGISQSRVTKSLERLQELQIISIESAASDRGGGVRWVILFDFTVWEEEPPGGSDATGRWSRGYRHGGSGATGSIGEQEEGRDLSEERSRDEQLVVVQHPAKVSLVRARNELFDACVEACGWEYAEMTDRQRRACGVAVAELKRVGATGTEILRRALVFKRVYPNASLTPNALANQWAAIGRVPDAGPSLSRGGQALMRGYQQALEREILDGER